METIHLNKTITLHSRLSFMPLINAWERLSQQGRPGSRKLYGELLKRVLLHPELLQPIDDYEILKQHEEWIDMLMTTIFPVSYSDDTDLYAVSVPFTYRIIYSSKLFASIFLDASGKIVNVEDKEIDKTINSDKVIMAYKMVLSKFYGVKVSGNVTTVHPFPDPVTGLVNYMELEIDPSFTDVVLNGELPQLDETIDCCNVGEMYKINNLAERIPLDRFIFEGMVIVRIKNVTEREAMSNIKNALLDVHSFSDPVSFDTLQKQIQTLTGLPGIRIGLSPFFKINNHYVFSELHSANSILLHKDYTLEKKQVIFNAIHEYFDKTDEPLIISNLTADKLSEFPFLKSLVDQGLKSVALIPLRVDKELIGLLSMVSEEADTLHVRHIASAMPAMPLFTLALERSKESLDSEVDKVIKHYFTAVQSSVEWKFTEAALDYLTQRKKGEDVKIEQIVFDNVYPLYGAIDVRNSSIVRNQAIQEDLLEQLRSAGSIIQKAQSEVSFPLLQEVSYRIEKYRYNVSNILFSGDEIIIDNFLKNEVVNLFDHLKQVVPAIKPDIEKYFSSLDKRSDMLHNRRRDFEESITRINNEIAKFFDAEQVAAQKIYPHYFERFVTDGVDFNIYIGQSISPDKPFDPFYLKNLKIWQLTTLAKAAQLTNKLEKKLKLPLHTTQLILANSVPISISFRTAERKFDVDGAYNIRYEIVKKRIDKVHIKDTNDRLTQPGKLAIVYSQPKEAAEYREYIEFLQNQGLLTGEIESFELEELQGVSGLKAMRVGINFETISPSVAQTPQKSVTAN